MKKGTQISRISRINADLLFREETEKIIGAFYKVHNVLGYGFLEKVYHNALYFQLLDNEFECKMNYPIKVYYNFREVGL